jgi:hypothetical protein
METLWVYALCAFLVAAFTDGGNPSLLATGIIVFGSFAISRLLQLSDLPLGIVRLWGLLLSFLIFYAVIRVDFYDDWRFWDFSWADDLFYRTAASVRSHIDASIGVPLLWLFWMRGVLRGQQRTGFDDVVSSFAIGIVVIAAVELLASTVDDAPATLDIVPVPYVAFGLLAIALAHASRSADEFSKTFAPSWIVAVGSAILGLGAIALFLVLLDYGLAADGIAAGARGVGWAVSTIFFYVSWPFFWVLEQMFIGLSSLLEGLLGGNPPDPVPLEEEVREQEEEEPSEPLPAWFQLLRRVLVTGLIVTLLLAVTAFMFRRYVRRENPQDVRESVYTEGRLSADLRDLLGSLLGRLRPSIHLREGLDPARRLYFDVLHAASERGIERRAGETPLELSPRLVAAFRAETPREVTHLFVDVRYGSRAATSDQVERLRKEWEGLGNQPSASSGK